MAQNHGFLGLIAPERKRPSLGRSVAKGVALAAVPAVAAPAVSKMARTVSKGREMAGQAADVLGTASSMKQAVANKDSTVGKVGAIVSEVRKIGKEDGHAKPKLSHLIEQHTDIAVPRHVVYDQWTQFESFASIMKAVESVEQDDRDKLSWSAKIGPSRRTWQTKIVEQIPDERIAWKSTGGAKVRGVVSFHELDEALTRVLVQMEYDPTGAVENIGNLLRIQRRRVKRDLRLFKHFIELRGEPTGASRIRIAKREPTGPQFAGQRSAKNQSVNGKRHGDRAARPRRVG